MVSVIVLAVLACGLAIGYFGYWRNVPSSRSAPSRTGSSTPSAAAASITASPNPIPAGPEPFGKTTIAWDTGDGSPGEVYVSVNGEPETRFSGSLPKGSQDADWIGKGGYEFRLYAGQEHKNMLASVRVTRTGS